MALSVALLFRSSLAENRYYWPSSRVGIMRRLHGKVSCSMQSSGWEWSRDSKRYVQGAKKRLQVAELEWVIWG